MTDDPYAPPESEVRASRTLHLKLMRTYTADGQTLDEITKNTIKAYPFLTQTNPYEHNIYNNPKRLFTTSKLTEEEQAVTSYVYGQHSTPSDFPALAMITTGLTAIGTLCKMITSFEEQTNQMYHDAGSFALTGAVVAGTLMMTAYRQQRNYTKKVISEASKAIKKTYTHQVK